MLTRHGSPVATTPRTSRRIGLALVVMVLVAGTASATVGNDSSARLAASVNTFIGTQDEGNTFPGASAPFGMIQISPIGEHYAGWRYDEKKIFGFGHSFVSGAGCWEQGGIVSVLPVTGTIAPGGDFDTRSPKSFDHAKYGSRFTHEGEIGQAGYYRVRLTDYGGIDVEATALTRAGAERYLFSGKTREGHVLVNVSQANKSHRVIGSQVRVVGDRAVEGKVTTLSFCGGHQYSTWFRIEFDRPFRSFGVWGQAGGTAGARFSMESEHDPRNGAWLTFDLGSNRTVTAVSAISHVDAEGARRNLEAEMQGAGRKADFDAIRTRAQHEWEQTLGVARIQGGSRDDRSVFHTALYHAFLQPMTGNDVDGRYRGYDDRIHEARDWTYYEYYSLWDTYRSQNQLLAMLAPQRARDIARSLLAIDEQGGWLPRWGYANFDSNVMTGDPVTPFLVDLWRYGALKGREADAWRALRKNAYGEPPLGSRHAGRSGNQHYLAKGYVLYDRTFPSKGMDVDPHQGGSATMEYALADCALSTMATALGHRKDASDLARRAGNWRKVWDASLGEPEMQFKGFPRPRMEDGSWFSPPQGYSPRSHYGFHEGTSWQYQWLVPQDVLGMAAAMGGRQAMSRRLDAFFAYDEIARNPAQARTSWVSGPYAYYGQYRFNPNNEPTMHVPALYSVIGEPWKTATIMRAAQTLFTNSPKGVTGNDDLGTMSAWYLFSTLGLYPWMPGSGQLLLNAPRFQLVELDVGPGKVLRIEAPGASADKVQYVSSVHVDGQSQERVWVDWDTLRRGGVLRFELSNDVPERGWGTHAGDAPAAACATGQTDAS